MLTDEGHACDLVVVDAAQKSYQLTGWQLLRSPAWYERGGGEVPGGVLISVRGGVLPLAADLACTFAKGRTREDARAYIAQNSR
ncbi:hypothetical protein SBA7_1650015 [Candidatus Sulfotelmatobacter sp. SbA7]|nr:hypothetical protein SBA7_1650015 [Candidatus Sulfotelmatobacter sp. SbA7]